MTRFLKVQTIFLLTAILAGCAQMDAAESPGASYTLLVPTSELEAREFSETGSLARAESIAPSAKIYKGNGEFLKQTPAEKAPVGPANISLNFEGADVREIAKTILAEILKESYIVDPRVQGTISFRTTSPLPKEALMPTLETVLRMNGVVVVKESGIFKIMPLSGIKGSLTPQLGGAIAGFTMQIVPLKFVGSREMAKILENIAADPSMVKSDELRNMLILAGTQNEIRHMLDTVEMFDVDWISGMSVGLFILQSADVKSVDQELTKVFSDKGGLNPLAGVVKLIPIERLNGFVIITPQARYLDQAKLWLERLDRVGSTGGTRLFVYHVQNGKAEHLAELLNQAFGGQKSQNAGTAAGPSVAPGLAGAQIGTLGARSATSPTQTQTTVPAKPGAIDAQVPVASSTFAISDDAGGAAERVRVVADAKNNALLILANSSGYEKIESALKKLDTSPRQVLIEVTIAEVTLKDELKYGVEWLFTNGPSQGGKLDLGSGLKAAVPGFSYAHTSAAGTINQMLNILATDNKLNILSSPHIMVADNQTAKIQVGDSVPTSGPQTVSGTGVVINSVQYLDTGVILSVTPRINAGGLVNLDITQEVSTASATTTSGLNSPTISKRTAQTSVAVQSGETMVLGGLMSEQNTKGTAGLPGLSNIPILGGLFGTQSHVTNRTELVVMITPRVANNFNQAKNLSDELRRKMGQAKDLLDCGTTNLLGYSSRGGLWCLQPGRFDGAIDRTKDSETSGRAADLR